MRPIHGKSPKGPLEAEEAAKKIPGDQNPGFSILSVPRQDKLPEQGTQPAQPHGRGRTNSGADHAERIMRRSRRWMRLIAFFFLIRLRSPLER